MNRKATKRIEFAELEKEKSEPKKRKKYEGGEKCAHKSRLE